METKENEVTEEENIFIEGIKKVSIFGAIYFLGYMNWSFLWIIAPAVFLINREQAKKKIRRKRNIARESNSNCEKDAIFAHFDELPAWVYFPDIERAEWLNKIIKQMWPNVNHYARDLISGPIEESLKHNLDNYKLKGFKFERIVLGSVPFRLGGVVVYDNVSRDEIVMDLDISYAGDCDITFHLSGMKGGIKNLQLYGKLRIVMKPLITTIPLVGGIQAFFLNNPDIDFDLVGIATILEIPGINDLLKKIVSDTISSMMVLPNKFPIQLSNAVDAADIKTPDPKGVLRIHIIEAKDLMKKDIGILGKGKSDPYAVLRVGAQEYRSKTIDSTVNPEWDEWCEFMVLEPNGQQLYIHLWDHDTTEDESLGMATIEISNLVKTIQSDMWITLEKAKHGLVHLRLTWLSLTKDYSDLEAAVIETQQLQVTNLNTAILTVFIDSAENLPQVRSSSKPDPYVVLQIGKQKHQTKVIMRTINPVWEEGFTFFISNPDTDSLVLKIQDSKTENNLGEIIYGISNLSHKENLQVLKEPFRVLKSDANTNILCSLRLRVLKRETKTEQVDENQDEVLHLRESQSSNDISAGKGKPPLEKKPSSISLISTISTTSEDVFGNNSFDNSSINAETTIHRSPSVTSSAGAAGLGLIYLTLRYSSQRQKLIVVVHRIANIPITDSDLPDVYVKLYLLPDRSKETKRKTMIIKNAYNPTFDETFEYLVSQAELNSKKLKVIVTADKIMKNDVLGEVLIELKNYDLLTAVKSWFDLMPELHKI